MVNEIIMLAAKSKNIVTDGTNPDITAYQKWAHVFDPTQNAMQTSEELMMFTFMIIIAFVFVFVIIYNIMSLIRIFRNLDGSFYQTKHILGKFVLIFALGTIDYFILMYVIKVAEIL